MLFLKLKSATCRAPQTMPSMVSGLSACRRRTILKHKATIKHTALDEDSDLHFLCNEVIQPASVDVIVSEAFSLQKLDEVFHCSPKVSSDGQLLHRYHHVSAEYQKCFSNIGSSTRRYF